MESSTLWAGVHTRLIVAIATQLNRSLPPTMVADIDEYVWVTEDSEDDRHPVKPDVFLPEKTEAFPSSIYPTDPASVSAATATVTLPASTLRKNRVVKIITADNSRVLTVLEILSPSNKNSGEDRDTYLRKRQEYFAAKVNVVEIDLLRDGDRLPMGRPRPPSADYYVLISRVGEYPRARVWAFSLREVLPVVPIPLDANTSAVPLELRPALDLVYDDGKYNRKIDYGRSPIPGLRKSDAEWANELLKSNAVK